MPAVAIDVPPELRAPEVAAVVQSCVAALGEGRCVLAAEHPESPWVAVVAVENDGLGLRVELRAGSAAGELTAERSLDFSRQDPVRQRWAAAGLVVASLVAEALAAPEPEPEPPFEAPSLAKARPVARRAPSPWWGGVDVAASLGPGLDEGPWRLGGQARLLAGMRAIPIVFLASGRYAEAAASPRARWMTLGVGVGARLGLPESALAAELRSEILFERVELTATSTAGSFTETAAVGRVGTSLGWSLIWRVYPHWALFADAELALKRPEITVEIEGRRTNGESAARGSAGLGARVLF